MQAQRKIGGVSDSYIVRFGNLEFAYGYYGTRIIEPSNLCNQVFAFNNPMAFTPTVGAFKVDGADWVVCNGGYYGSEPHSFLVSKFAKPKDRLPLEIFMPLFMEAYSKALIEESSRILDKLNKGELSL